MPAARASKGWRDVGATVDEPGKKNLVEAEEALTAMAWATVPAQVRLTGSVPAQRPNRPTWTSALVALLASLTR